MAFVKVHGLTLANGAYIENAVLESMSTDLAGVDLTAAAPGRMYYNNATDLFMGVVEDGMGGKVLRAFATGSDVNVFISNLASIDEGKGSDLIGYDGHTGSNGFFSVAPSGLGDSIDKIVQEIDNIEQTMSTYEDTFVNVAGDSMTGDLSMGGNKVTNVALCTADTDAANKAYVDSVRMGLDAKKAVRVISENDVDITTGGLLTIDGVTVVEGDRVLLVGQTDGAENGIYVASENGWVRSEDLDEPSEIRANVFCFVSEGNTYSDTGWVLTTNNPIILGTDDLVFVQFSAAGVILAGVALEKIGNILNVKYDNNTITLDGSGNLQVNTTVVTAPIQSELDETQLGAGLETDGTYVADMTTNYLSGATSLKNADKVLDEEIKKIADDLAALGSGSLTDLQNEVDAIETSLGAMVAEDGTYVAHTTTNYINGNTNVTEDLVDLDGAIKVVGDTAGDIQVELDATQLGAGLETDGTYVSDMTTNYLSGATSLKNADKLLDIKVKELEDELDALGSGSLTDLQNEIDATQTGAGLNTDGSYVVNTLSPTLSGAVSLKDADDKLAQALEALETSIESSVFTYQASVAATQHVITHNLNSDFVECQVWVLDLDTGKYHGDIVGQTVESSNQIVIDLTVARVIRVIVRK